MTRSAARLAIAACLWPVVLALPGACSLKGISGGPSDSGVGDVSLDTRDTGDSAATPADAPAAEGAPGDGGDGSTGDGGSCDPTADPSQQACVIDEAYGVFVSPVGDDATGSGTRMSPYATIGHALGNLHGHPRVYVCAAAYPEAVTLTGPDAASLYGGLSCASGAWIYTGSPAKVLSPAGAALTITSSTAPLTLADLELDGAPGTAPGTSSIACLVNAATSVSLTRVKLVAAAGTTGAAGSAATSNDSPTPLVGSNATAGVSPGAPVACSCALPAGAGSAGGAGGSGSGLPGTATPPATASGSSDGMGGSGGVSCAKGDPGASGAGGGPGSGGTGGTLGATGWVGGTGGAGAAGNPGQGGGGGGASGTLGVEGGGGACGGCGGGPGQGGGGGGASIALVVLGSTVTATACHLVVATGGMGGNGGPGLGGQGGGIGGFGGCNGGNGGDGGGGGGGGGGAGGPAIGIAWTGTAPTVDGVSLAAMVVALPGPSTFMGGVGGAGGQGGAGASSTSAGTAGQAGQAGSPGLTAVAVQL